MPERPRLSIIIPVYNEAENLEKLIPKINALRLTHCEIIVVDDGSSDGSADVALKAGANVVAPPIQYRKRRGGEDRHARGKREADLAHGRRRPAPTRRYSEAGRRKQAVPHGRGRSSQRVETAVPSLRGEPGLQSLRVIYHSFSRQRFDFRVSRFFAGRGLRFIHLLPNTFSYPTTLTLAFLRSGLSVRYVPIKSLYRAGQSKISLISDGVRFFLIIAKIATLFAPFRVFMPVSMTFFMGGLANYIYTFVTEHRFTNMSVFLLTTAVLIFMLGLISEQIALLRMEQGSRRRREDYEPLR